MANKVIVNGLNIGYLPPTYSDDILYNRGGGTTTVKDKIDQINSILSGKIQIKDGGYVSNLNISTSTLSPGDIIRYTYNSSTSNIPTTGSGTCIMIPNTGSTATYGRQITIDDQGIYTRALIAGVYESTWTYISGPVVKWEYGYVLSGGNYPFQFRKIGMLVQVFFWCDKAIPTGTVIFTIPEHLRPFNIDKYPNRLTFLEQLKGGSQLHINNNGEVAFSATTTAQWYQWNFTYMSKY